MMHGKGTLAVHLGIGEVGAEITSRANFIPKWFAFHS